MSENGHKCSYCEYTTFRTYNLKRHIGRVHTVEGEQDAEKFHGPAEKFHGPAGKFHGPAEKFHGPAGKFHGPAESQTTDESSDGSKQGFKCSKCSKSYTRRSNMKAHEETCAGLTVLQCPYCSKSFTSTKGKSHHKKVCKEVPKTDTDLPDPTIINNQNNYNHCTVNNNNITNNIQINITNFNSENTDYITEEFARKCFESGVHGVNPMIDKLYFDEEHPENHNVKLKSLNHSLVEVHTDKGWVPHGLYNIIDRMIYNSTGTILLKIRHMPMNVDEDALRLNAIQNITPEHKKKIRERTKSQLVARRELIDQ